MQLAEAAGLDGTQQQAQPNARAGPASPASSGRGRRGAEEGAPRPQLHRQPQSVPPGGPETVRQPPGSFEDWLSTSLRQAAHHMKAATMTLVHEQRIDTHRVALCWNNLVWTAGEDCTGGLAHVLYSEILAPGAAAQGQQGGASATPLVPVEPVRPPSSSGGGGGGGAVYPFSESAVLRRLMADQESCHIFHRLDPGAEELVCSERMGETFVTTAQLKAVHQQFGGPFCGYLWCTFVVPEDRPQLMHALSSIIYEKGSRLQNDCIIRCINREGRPVRCLASVGFHAEEQKSSIAVLRLNPLGFRGIILPAAPAASSSSSSSSGHTYRHKRRWNERTAGSAAAAAGDGQEERAAQRALPASVSSLSLSSSSGSTQDGAGERVRPRAGEGERFPLPQGGGGGKKRPIVTVAPLPSALMPRPPLPWMADYLVPGRERRDSGEGGGRAAGAGAGAAAAAADWRHQQQDQEQQQPQQQQPPPPPPLPLPLPPPPPPPQPQQQQPQQKQPRHQQPPPPPPQQQGQDPIAQFRHYWQQQASSSGPPRREMGVHFPRPTLPHAAARTPQLLPEAKRHPPKPPMRVSVTAASTLHATGSAAAGAAGQHQQKEEEEKLEREFQQDMWELLADSLSSPNSTPKNANSKGGGGGGR